MADPVPCLAQPFPFQHAHTPEKEPYSHRTEDHLVQIHLKATPCGECRFVVNTWSNHGVKMANSVNQRFGRCTELQPIEELIPFGHNWGKHYP